MIKELIERYDAIAVEAELIEEQINALKKNLAAVNLCLKEEENLIDSYLKDQNIESMREGSYKLYYKTSKPVVYDDETLIPEEYMRKKVEIDGAKIRAVLLKNGHVPGARIGEISILKIEKTD